MQAEVAIIDKVPVKPKPFDVGARGLVVTGNPTFQEWQEFGLTLRELKTAIQWAVGDWINYGEEHYPDRYAQAEDETKYAYGTLRNYASVAERVDCNARVTGLSWSHHAAVASLPAEQQGEVLEMAKQKKLSRDDVRGIVQKRRGDAAPRLVRATFDVPSIAAIGHAKAGWCGEVSLTMAEDVIVTLDTLLAAHSDVKVTLVVTYPAP